MIAKVSVKFGNCIVKVPDVDVLFETKSNTATDLLASDVL